ncbi:MAG: ferritin-like domain-containing protein [Legionellales bacterium]|nr:ferritin-like domain-containing protein [Legionellales bacterium]
MINVFSKIEEALFADEFIDKYCLILELAKFIKMNDTSLINIDPLLANTVRKEPSCGRPKLPNLVEPKKLARRGIGTVHGKASLIHAIAHIEFNAINLALDAAYRFSDMPKQYYFDWLKIALEECEHFMLLNNYLRKIGYVYGDFDAHNGLWEMAKKTSHDVLVRMALVPRVLEARGLDVTPGIIQKFLQTKDYEAVRVLQIIQTDEIGHVKIGNYWYKHLCKERQVDHINTFNNLIAEYAPDILQPPFDINSRKLAGFSEDELSLLHN